MPKDFNAVIVGSGPNGLAAAITLQKAGLSVLLLEAKETIGGGMRTSGLTLPGFRHDVCSAVHPMAIGSPFFSGLPLKEHGLEFIHAPIPAAHPLDNGKAAALYRSITTTASSLGIDGSSYLELIGPLTFSWPKIAGDVLGPIGIPEHPLLMAQFGFKAMQPSSWIAGRFASEEAKALWAGMSAHSIQPLTNWSSSAIGMVLAAVGHLYGWPIPKGGSQSIADALASYFVSLGGKIETGHLVKSFDQLPSSDVVLFDVSPKQLLQIAGEKFSALYKWQLGRYRYGMGVFKIDWALDGPIPFTAFECRTAATVHIGGTFDEIASAEQLTSSGGHPERPFVLLAQPSLFDTTRAPTGKHTAWAYCHVPNGSTVNMVSAIEKQVERFAPGFRNLILARSTMNASEMEVYNPNYIGGDINGGIIDIGQLFTRPALRLSPYRTSSKGIYICSASTPPGGGVHGLCGYHAAKTALKDVFNIAV